MGRTPVARDTRERILDAALAEFAARGYASASIDDIAARADVTKGAVYYYFEDKADLARDLQRALWERLKEQATAVLDPAADTLTNLRRGFDAYLGALEGLGQARFFLRDTWSIGAADPTTPDDRGDAYAFVRALLEEGIACGEVAPLDPEAMARALVGIYTEATLFILETGEPGPTIEVIDRLITALVPAPLTVGGAS